MLNFLGGGVVELPRLSCNSNFLFHFHQSTIRYGAAAVPTNNIRVGMAWKHIGRQNNI